MPLVLPLQVEFLFSVLSPSSLILSRLIWNPPTWWWVKCYTCYQRIINPFFLFRDIFYVVSLLRTALICSMKISRILEPLLGRLMSCGRTVTLPLSTRYLMHQMTKRLKMLLFPPVLFPCFFIASFHAKFRRYASFRRSSSSRSSPSGWCWYHSSHGEEAQRCKSPCSYVSGNWLTQGRSKLTLFLSGNPLSSTSWILFLKGAFSFPWVTSYLFWSSLQSCWLQTVNCKGGCRIIFSLLVDMAGGLVLDVDSLDVLSMGSS